MKKAKRFNMNERICDLLSVIETITDDESMQPSAKSNKLRSVGITLNEEVNYVFDSDNSVKNNFTLIRNKIRDSGLKHHMFTDNLCSIELNNKWLENELVRHAGKGSKALEMIVSNKISEAQRMYKIYEEHKNKTKTDEFLRIIKDLNGLKIFPVPFYHLTLSKEQQEMINKSQREKRQLSIQSGQVKIPLEFTIDLCESLLQSEDHRELALGLGLATGRRFSEIYNSGVLERASANSVVFSGQAKKRGVSDEPYEIYTIVDSEIVLDALDNLRRIDVVFSANEEAKKQDSLSVINQKFSVAGSRIAKKHLGTLNEEYNWNFSATRAIWARIVFTRHFHIDKKWKDSSEDFFWQSMLGHSDPSTQLDYKKFKMVDSSSIKTITTFDFIIDADDLIRDAAKEAVVKEALILSAHEKLLAVLLEEPKKIITVGYLKRTVKRGGLGLTSYVAVEYFSIIEPFLRKAL